MTFCPFSPQAANLLNLRQLLQLTHDFVDLLVLPVPIPFPLKSTLPSTSKLTEPASPSPLRPDVPSELDVYGYQLVEHYISWAVDKTEEEVRDEIADGGLEGVEASEDLIEWVTKLNQTVPSLPLPDSLRRSSLTDVVPSLVLDPFVSLGPFKLLEKPRSSGCTTSSSCSGR